MSVGQVVGLRGNRTKKQKKQGSISTNTAHMEVPRTEMEKKFCAAWLNHYNKDRAAREAGYVGGSKGNRLFRRFSTYLAKRQLEKEKEITKVAIRGQKEILEELMAMGFANPLDYMEVYEEGGKTKVRQKPITSLTRLQAAAIANIKFDKKTGTATYRIPNRDEKIPGLIAAGRHFGMFHDKLIQEHRHLHMRQSVDLTDVGNTLLEEVEAKLLQAVGPQKARQLLGVTIEGEYEDVSDATPPV